MFFHAQLDFSTLLLRYRYAFRVGLYSITLYLLFNFVTQVKAEEVFTFEPNEPTADQSCLAFGAGPGGFPDVSPFMGLMYQNLPALSLKAGDTLAFDLSQQNEVDIELDIEIATLDPSTLEPGPFTKLVSNTQTPVNPRGDDVIGNFELQFTLEKSFDFPGGGLILRFSNGSSEYQTDVECTFVGVVASVNDSSNFFLGSFFGDQDGLLPWENLNAFDPLINGFQVTIFQRVNILSTVLDTSGRVIDSALVGDVITHQLTVTNTFEEDATGVEISSILPDNTEFLQADATPAAAAVFNSGEVDSVLWTVGSLPAGDTATLDIDLRTLVNAMGTSLSNTTEIVATDAPFESGTIPGSSIDIGGVPLDTLEEGGEGNCFIATAAYGSYLESEVVVLRRFRDAVLLRHRVGRSFVDWYYLTSPPVADAIRNSEPARLIVRTMLSPVVYGIKYPTFSVLLIGIIILAAPILFFRRRQITDSVKNA